MIPSLESLLAARPIFAIGGLALLLMVETAKPFVHYFRGRERWAHAGRNLFLGLLNAGVVAVGFAGLWVLATVWADERGFGLMNFLADSLGAPWWVHAGGAILILDGWTYFWHRINHEIPFLWSFHRVHHADAELDVTTASRFHVGELILSSVLRIPVLVIGGVVAWELVLYEMAMFAVVQFHHANLGLPPSVDRALRGVIVTPAMHRVHHSRWRPETDSNYGSLLSIWDRLFRSFRLRDRPEEIEVGLDEFSEDEHRTVTGMLRMPLAKIRRPPDDHS